MAQKICAAKLVLLLYGADSGNDKDAGKKVLKVLAGKGWRPEMILNTHSHADHIGGNRVIQERTGCRAYCPGLDTSQKLP